MRQLTIEEPKDKKVESEYGEISYYEWCKLEMERINRDGGKCLLKELDDTVSIWTTEKLFNVPSRFIKWSPGNGV